MVAPVVLNNESIRAIVGHSKFFQLVLMPHFSFSTVSKLISEIIKCPNVDAIRRLLASKQIFTVIMKKPLKGRPASHHHDGFCYWVSEASAFYGHTILLDNKEHRNEFIHFYTNIWPNMMGPIRINKSIANPKKKANRPATMKLLVEKVVEKALIYPTEKYTGGLHLLDEYWGGAEALSRFSYLLGDAKENKHMAYWHEPLKEEQFGADVTILHYLIGSSASVENPGTCDAWFDKCGYKSGWSIQNLINGWNGICFHYTFTGDHFYECNHEGNKLTSELMLAEVEDMWSDWLSELQKLHPSDSVRSFSTSNSMNPIDPRICVVDTSGEERSPSQVLNNKKSVHSLSNGTADHNQVVSHLHGIREGKNKAAKLLAMTLETDQASLAIGEFASQNFSHMKCNDYHAPSSQILANQIANNILKSDSKNKRKR